MPTLEIIVPQLTDAVTDMVVVDWLVSEGQEFEKGQQVMEVETDKANQYIEAPDHGFIQNLLVKKGDTISVGQVIANIVPSRFYIPGKVKIESGDSPDLYGVVVRLGVICEHCNNAIPVNGFTERIKCGKCQETTELKGKRSWKELLNYHNPSIDIFTATKKHNPGEGDYGAWQPVKLKTWRKWSECSSCHHQFEQKDLKLAVERNGLINCPGCAATIHMKPVPDFIKKQFPGILYSSDHIAAIDPITSQKGTSKPIVMTCMSCGGALRVDGKGRMVDCEFCGSSNYLPDDLWLAMHPQEKMEDWFILFK